jgi:hypothetical protein
LLICFKLLSSRTYSEWTILPGQFIPLSALWSLAEIT